MEANSDQREPVNPALMARNVLLLLQTDPRLYRNFGVYWWLVKHLLKQHYTRDNLYLLGDYIDREAAARIPHHADVREALQAAIDTYNINAQYNMGRDEVMAPDGELVRMWDDDAGF